MLGSTTYLCSWDNDFWHHKVVYFVQIWHFISWLMDRPLVCKSCALWSWTHLADQMLLWWPLSHALGSGAAHLSQVLTDLKMDSQSAVRLQASRHVLLVCEVHTVELAFWPTVWTSQLSWPKSHFVSRSLSVIVPYWYARRSVTLEQKLKTCTLAKGPKNPILHENSRHRVTVCESPSSKRKGKKAGCDGWMYVMTSGYTSCSEQANGEQSTLT